MTTLPARLPVALACVAQFMVVLDTSIVNVALPSIRSDLGLDVGAQQWVVTAYLLTFGGLLLLAARTCDVVGPARVFRAGLVLFTLASLVGALAPGGLTLLAARAVQGVGAAALAPSSLTLVTATVADPTARAKALSWWSMAAASAGAAGIVLGGLLTTGLGWRWVLLVNVPVGAALLLGARPLRLPTTGGTSLDVPGAVLVTLTAASLVHGLSRATTRGWSDPWTLASLGAAVASLLVLIAIERSTPSALLPGRVLKLRGVRVANSIGVVLGVVMTSLFFFTSVYLQQVLGYSAARTGLALLPWTLALVAGVVGARHLLRIGPGPVVAAGGLLTSVGLGWLSRVPAEPAYLTGVLGPTVVVDLGLSAMVLPVTVVATSEVSRDDAGLASGLVNAGRQLGGAVGLAALGTVAAGGAATAGELPLVGIRLALLCAAGLALLPVLAAPLLGRTERSPAARR